MKARRMSRQDKGAFGRRHHHRPAEPANSAPAPAEPSRQFSIEDLGEIEEFLIPDILPFIGPLTRRAQQMTDEARVSGRPVYIVEENGTRHRLGVAVHIPAHVDLILNESDAGPLTYTPLQFAARFGCTVDAIENGEDEDE